MKRVLWILGLVALTLAGCTKTATTMNAESESGIVQTEYGALQGGTSDGIYTYSGVPYAEARECFVPAEKLTPWPDLRNATDYGPIPLQSSAGGFPAPEVVQSNNAQNLNIWTPGLDGNKRAVMVWLHGGGFSNGSAQEVPAYNGENLSHKGDVVNHRVTSISPGFAENAV